MPRRVAVVIFPPARAMVRIEAFRRAHDSLHAWIRAHITLVFPFACPVHDVHRRLARLLPGARGFPVVLEGAGRYADGTVYLRLASGAAAAAALHRALTGALLGPAARTCTPAYRPHLTVSRAADPASARRLASLAAALGTIAFDARAISLVREEPAGHWRTFARFSLGSSVARKPPDGRSKGRIPVSPCKWHGRNYRQLAAAATSCRGQRWLASRPSRNCLFSLTMTTRVKGEIGGVLVAPLLSNAHR